MKNFATGWGVSEARRGVANPRRLLGQDEYVPEEVKRKKTKRRRTES